MNPEALTRCPACGRALGELGYCIPCLLAQPVPAPPKAKAISAGIGDNVIEPEAAQPELEIRAQLTFGDYHLLRELGRGGMGVVYLARKLSLKKEVAVKFMKAGHDASEFQVGLFLREAELMSQLDHPNIASVLDVGELRGYRYLVMRYIDGVPLSQWLADPASDAGENRRSMRLRVRLIQTVSSAVHYAHQRGIIHRDLKPGNILVDPSTVPFVTDFGLARWIEGQSTVTISGGLVGTPAFMAPEQVGSARGSITVASDLWSLGVILYQLTSGRLPFEGQNVPDTLRRISEIDPPDPTLPMESSLSDSGETHTLPADLSPLSEAERRDLGSICLRCLEKEPTRRYPSVGDFSEDLGRWLEGLPVIARPVRRVERIGRWIRRRPALAGLIAASLATLVSIAAAAWQKKIRTATDRLRREYNYAGDMNVAGWALADTNYPIFSRSLQAAAPQNTGDDFRGVEWGLLKSLALPLRDTAFYDAGESIQAVDLSPNEQQVAALTTRRLVVLNREGKLRREWPVAHDGGKASVSFSSWDNWIATGTSSGIDLFNHVTGEHTRTGLPESPFRLVKFSPSGRSLAATTIVKSPGEPKEKVLLFDLPEKKKRILTTNDGPALVWISDEHLRLADRRAGIHDWRFPADDWSLRQAPGFSSPTAAFSPDGRFVVRTSIYGVIQAIEVDSGTTLLTETGFPARDVVLAVSKNGRLLAGTTMENTIRIRPIQSPTEAVPATTLTPGHSAKITALRFFQDEAKILSGSLDGKLRINSLQPESHLPYISLPHDLINGAGVPPIFSPDSRYVALLQSNNYYRTDLPDRTILWDVTRQSEIATLPSQVIAWDTPHQLLTWDHDGRLKLWEFHPPEPPREIRSFLLNPEHQMGIDSQLADHGRWVISVDDNQVVHGYHVRTRRDYTLPNRQIEGISSSPSTPRVAIALTTGGTLLWNPESGRTVPLGQSVNADQAYARFSPSGRYLAVADWQQQLTIYDGESGTHLFRLTGQTAAVVTMAFTPDEQGLVVGSDDYSLTIWHLSTRREVFRRRMEALVYWISVAPDRSTLVTGHFPVQLGGKGHFRIWPLHEELPRLRYLSPSVPDDSLWKQYQELPDLKK